MEFDGSIDISLEGFPSVYSPAEDSYLLLESIDVNEGESFLEMGTGSGILALHASKTGAHVTAVDINPKAVECCRQNAEINGLAVSIVESDLFSNIDGRYDVIAFNPPYLPSIEGNRSTEHEMNDCTWDGGPSGGAVISRYLKALPAYLKDNGRAYLLLSSLTIGALKETEDLNLELIATKPLFFEELYVYIILN